MAWARPKRRQGRKLCEVIGPSGGKSGCIARCDALEPRTLLSAGAPDTSFGGDGVAESFLGIYEHGTAADVAVQSDGKTVVVGTTQFHEFALARFNVNGSMDTTFGPSHNGTVITKFDRDSQAEAVAITNEGKIVVVGKIGEPWEFARPLVTRYNPDGTPDATFDGNGKMTFAYDDTSDNGSDASAVAILPGGKLLVAGTCDYGDFDNQVYSNRNDDFAFARLNDDGSLDETFGNDGRFDKHGTVLAGLGDWEHLAAVAVDNNGTAASNPNYGKIVAVGTKTDKDNTYSQIGAVRLNADGSPDGTFDGDGKASYTQPEIANASAAGVAIQPDDRIVVGGTVNNDFLLLRLDAAGKLDDQFWSGPPAGTHGYSVKDVGGADAASDLLQTPDGELILVGTTNGGAPGAYTSCVAFTSTGAVDPQYGDAGVFRVPALNVPGKLAYGPGRRFVFAGGTEMTAVRFLDSGANVVRVATLNPQASEAGPTTRGFFVYRSERLPYATGVFFTVGGSAVSPVNNDVIRRPLDYTGISAPPNDGIIYFDTGYAVIPANETYTVVNITPIDDTRAEGTETATFTLQNHAGYDVGSPWTVTMYVLDNDVTLNAAVVGRQVFYNNSLFDGNDPAANDADAGAVAPDKVALLPGQTPSFANYTSYSRGINGIIINVNGLPAGARLGPSDFGIKVGRGDNPDDWVDGPPPAAVAVRPGVGRIPSRVTLTWPDGAIKNEWVQVTMRSNLNTGLPTPDVFSFGNLVGETGNTPGKLSVDAADGALVRSQLFARNQPITSTLDFDRNGVINTFDLNFTRFNQRRALLPVVTVNGINGIVSTASAFASAPARAPWRPDGPLWKRDGISTLLA